MPIRKIKNFVTPEGYRQRQITEYFKNTGLSSVNRRLFVDDSTRSDMYKKKCIIDNESEDEFIELTPAKKISLPYPIYQSDDEENELNDNISKKDVADEKSKASQNSKKSPGNSVRRKSKITKVKKPSSKTIESEKPKKCTDEDSSDCEKDETPSKKLKFTSTSEHGNVNISVQISIPGVSTPNTPKSSKISHKIGSTSSRRSTLNSNKKSSPPKAPNKNNLKQEDCKLNFKHVELLTNIFKETLQDVNKKALLTTKEINFIEGFLKMDENHQYFLIKLFTYQHLWYNMLKFCSLIKLDKKLSPQEITKMYEYHKENFYVSTDISEESTTDLLDMILIGDLKKIALELNLKLDLRRCKKRAEIIEALCRNSKTQSTLTKTKSSADILKDVVLKHLGHCIKLKDDAKSSFHKAYILQTYSNSSYYTDIQNFFKDIGFLGVTYPNYNVEENFTPFKTKEQFSRYYEAVSMKIELEKAIESKDMVAMKEICDRAFEKLKNVDDDAKCRKHLPGFLHKFSAEYVYISILKGCIKMNNKNHDDVKIWLEYLIENYPNNQAIGFWYKHLAHIMMQYNKNYETAAEIAIKAYEFNRKENIFDYLQVFELNKLANKLMTTKSYKLCNLFCDQLAALSESPVDTENFPKKFIKARTDRRETPGKRIYSFTDENDEVSYGGVEIIALKHYASNENYEGLHCEGQLIKLLFALLFWDIIYEYYVPMTFISKLQNAPLDMYSNTFYQNRKDEIELRLKEIATDWSVQKLEETLRENWRNHSHEKSIVDFENIKDVERLLEIFRCFNRTVLSKILGRLATNYRRFRSGLPDLFLWDSEQSKCKFVEVKGENDKLQPNQILWIQYLLDVGAVVEVCHVSGVGGKNSSIQEKKKD